MTDEPAPSYRKPASGPEPVSRHERAAFDALVAQSLPTVRASAQAWRNGLTALIGLVTAGVAIQGRTTAAELSPGWRAGITVLIGAGLAAAVVGLWHALGAEAGTRAAPLTLADIHARHASVAAYQVALAKSAGQRLSRARTAVAVSIALLLTGVIATWWAPPIPSEPPAYVRVTDQHGTTCGTLLSADGGQVRLEVAGSHDPAVIALTGVTNLAVVAACP
ncbi:hypothetical protein F4553_007561 [Allocatelliglobosispora scoriae]|uniref:Uncharacterized protein n=1 Tax=Allocatelliglobosispora scoriae TaxID=643052 RepID=A0A841BY95_9ACTN|nr:hypothetical protein [Allocatelliglobosispora scoriae]MBB5874127.1 hypothetical protein [Allocatelliglobosispora scoriae]